MKTITIRIFDDNDLAFSQSDLTYIIEQCNQQISGNYSNLGYTGVEIEMHKVSCNREFEDCATLLQGGLDGISIFDFELKGVRPRVINPVINQLNQLDTNNHLQPLYAYLSTNPGYVLACLAAISQNNRADIWIGTTNSVLRGECTNILRNLLSSGVTTGTLDMGILSYNKSSLITKLKGLVESYIKKRQEPPPPPEQAIIDFFEWRRNDSTATTTALHTLDDANLTNFKRHSAYEALRGLLRLNELELDTILHSDGCQRALLEALKGMGADDDKLVNQQCSIFGLFLIAWSAFRVKNTQSNIFQDALKSFSEDWKQCESVSKSHPVTRGCNSMSAVLSAFFLFSELATDSEAFTTNQVDAVVLNRFGFEIRFKLKTNALDDFKSKVETVFSQVHQNVSRGTQKCDINAGSLTSKALIHLMMDVGCRQSLFGGDQRAEMSVQWRDSAGILVIKFSPRRV
jgi:hypothetical protein